jgi:DNA mismatch endonuclease (patch repair protein)
MSPRDTAITSRIMAGVPNRDTRPELALRKELHRRGLRYRVRSTLLGKPDLVFARSHVTVFVDGDFWHGNTWRLRGFPNREAYFASHANTDFWRLKITANIERDRHVTASLNADGWHVLRFWESDITRAVTDAADVVERTVRERLDNLRVAS